ncbi:DUF4190 domain-containing protein [Streptomyces indicus]|uniref:DUF4190 domain-containing protein n=1 Tax=Streptomyces indicus TaxID=417292 RepID=A0A1G9D8F2_9ACTN|nr:DUF4190 domain-containing protein [Streptomyces indicus]SDK60169.1 hypothetical protein SAMN05421806_10979 [Streptomyces indicus]
MTAYAPQYPPYYAQPVKPKTDSLATASMILGIVSLVVPFIGIVTGPLAVISAVKGKTQMQFNGEGGNGLAMSWAPSALPAGREGRSSARFLTVLEPILKATLRITDTALTSCFRSSRAPMFMRREHGRSSRE